MFRPLAFFRRVPVAFVALTQALPLLADPTGVRLYANLTDQCEDRSFAFSSGVDAKACRHCVCGKPHVKLTGFSVVRHRNRELQIYLRFVGCFVSREANVAVDARKVRTRPRGNVEARVQLEHVVRKLFQKATKRLNDAGLVALAVDIHPRFAVIAAKVFKKSKGLARENGCWLRHVGLNPCFRGRNGDSQPTRFRSGVNPEASRLVLAAMRTERLVCVHEQLYTHRKNQGPPQTRPRKLRSRIDLSHPGRGVRLPGRVHRQWNADCGANQLCARGRQIVSARLDGKPFDEDAGERRAFLPERYAPRRHRLLAQRDGPLGQLPICGGDGESGNRRGEAAKLAAMRDFVEYVIRGRWATVLPPTEQELKGTMVLSVPLVEASAKVRTGFAVNDDKDYVAPAWTGVIPMKWVSQTPVPDPRGNPAIPAPANIRKYSRPQ